MAHLLPKLSAPDKHWMESAYDFASFHPTTQRRIRHLFNLHNVQVRDLNRSLSARESFAEPLRRKRIANTLDQGWKSSTGEEDSRRQIEELTISAKGWQDLAEEKEMEAQQLLGEVKRKDAIIAKLEKGTSKSDRSIEKAVAEVKALKAQVQDLPTTLTRKTDPTDDDNASLDIAMALNIAENEIKRLENRVSSLQEDIAEVEMVHRVVVEDLKQNISEMEKAARDTEERHATEATALNDRISELLAKKEDGQQYTHAATATLQKLHDVEKTVLKVRITQLEAELGKAIHDREAAVAQREQAHEQLPEVTEMTRSMQTQIDMLKQEKTSQPAILGDEEYTLSSSVQSTSNEVHPWQLDTEDLCQWVRHGKKSWLQQHKPESSEAAEKANGDEGRGLSEACSVCCDVEGGEKETEQPLLDLDPEEHEACEWPVLAADNDTQAAEYWCGSAVARFSTSGIEDQQSFQSGLAVGTYKGRIEGRMAGHQAGMEEGFVDGFERGKVEGYKVGQQHVMQQEETRRTEATRNAFAEGEVAGFKDGFTRGLAQGLQSTIEEVSGEVQACVCVKRELKTAHRHRRS